MINSCKTCGAAIDFINTTKGRTMPVNVPPVRVITVAGELVTGYTTHWATCPTAAQHRKPKAQTTDQEARP